MGFWKVYKLIYHRKYYQNKKPVKERYFMKIPILLSPVWFINIVAVKDLPSPYNYISLFIRIAYIKQMDITQV